ncbi:cytochrome c3 family protein [Sandarakinorhabdus sp.]|uniref:cytochrome c3 family protein n=1 Tax=Sandarakinorhabdus sp. TaxID=1916663 RepID=UPI00286E31B5|nr:cytochrome c3 family protein [Sandarakinorhabdus sp.]
MSFVIRQIAKRADGGDIIRTRALPGSEITVGRGTDCDIQIADLGIMLRHVRLVQLPGGRVAVEALGGVPVAIDGKFVSRADLAVVDNPAIDLASHRLLLSPHEDGSIAVTAERVIAPVDAADAALETGIFSLGEAMPSKRAMAWIGALLVLLGLLGWPLLHFMGEQTVLPGAMITAATQPGKSPVAVAGTGLVAAADKAAFTPDMVWSTGGLSSVHASLSNNCGACHQKAFVSVTDGACQACHKPDALPEHAAPDRLARGQLPETGVIGAAHRQFGLPAGRCASCHREHEGPASVTTVAEQYCTDCHAGLNNRLPDTSLTNVPDWAGHPQFRPRLVAQPSATTPLFRRAVLESTARENSGLVYPHDLHQLPRGAVANMAQKQGLKVGPGGALGCGSCHEPDADGIRFRPISMEKDCGACHDLAFARDGGTLRTLPHGKPAQVAGIIRDFYLSRSLAPHVDRSMPGLQPIAFARRAPGRLAEAEAIDLGLVSPAQARGRAEAAVAAVFGAKGLCSECHAISSASGRPVVAPVTLGDHYLTRARFGHKQHRIFDRKTGDAACVACHTSTTASKLASDVLLPPIATCRQCHGAPAARLSGGSKVSADCNSCHSFHQLLEPPSLPPRRAAFAAVHRRAGFEG